MLLENTEQTIPLATEIKMLQLYIDLTKIRYKNAFNYSIEIDEKINQEEVAIPTLLLQPIVENAIIHGLSPKKENGLLLISFYKKENQLECVVKDNGIGRKASVEKQKHKQHESKAIEITKERLNLLEKDENIKSDFTIEDLYDTNNNGMGTIVTISIPFKNIW
jgi:LytS/YehU family sensor histidine kinase